MTLHIASSAAATSQKPTPELPAHPRSRNLRDPRNQLRKNAQPLLPRANTRPNSLSRLRPFLNLAHGSRDHRSPSGLHATMAAPRHIRLHFLPKNHRNFHARADTLIEAAKHPSPARRDFSGPAESHFPTQHWVAQGSARQALYSVEAK